MSRTVRGGGSAATDGGPVAVVGELLASEAGRDESMDIYWGNTMA